MLHSHGVCLMSVSLFDCCCCCCLLFSLQAQESVSSGLWLSDCFVYVTRNCRLRCFCGGRTQTLHTLEAKELSILAVVAEHNRIYLVGPDHAVYAFSLNQAAIQYQVHPKPQTLGLDKTKDIRTIQRETAATTLSFMLHPVAV